MLLSSNLIQATEQTATPGPTTILAESAHIISALMVEEVEKIKHLVYM